MNEFIDLSKESLHNDGNIWVNKQSGQLRYSLSKQDPSKWLIPLSTYKIGNNGAGNNTYIKRGQPVSVGLIEDLTPENKISADPYIVPTNPSKYQWCIGLALEPGNASTNVNKETVFDEVHIINHGQIEFDLNDTRDNVFQPPSKNGKYLWTYDDIGKPVYVSNHPDDNNGKPGGLTIDITHAYFNGANIISIGRLADAPTATQIEQKITLEIQLSGDVRGMIDSTQFAVNLDPDQEYKEFTTTYDKLIFVKISFKNVNGVDVPMGYIIYDDLIMTQMASNTPVGCFLVKPVNGRIQLNKYKGDAVLIHRLGILAGNFNYNTQDYGKELFLSKGEATPTGSAATYEYKVGVLFDNTRVLVDCRFPKQFQKFTMIGDLKPAYMEIDTINPPGKFIADPGYITIIPGQTHKVIGPWQGDTQSPDINFEDLLKTTLHTNMYEYCDDDGTGNPSNNWRDIDGSDDLNSIYHGFFRFKNIFYNTSDGRVCTQIKYTSEGSPEEMNYIWPEMSFDYTFIPGQTVQGYFGSSNIKFNIDYLVNLGHYTDAQNKSIEFYDISLKILDAASLLQQGVLTEGDVSVSPGFYMVYDETEQKHFWAGYEWGIAKEGNSWFLKLITKPGAFDSNGPGYIDPDDCWGFCYPAGKKLTVSVRCKIFIRRRPTQYHNLFLNQLVSQLPWMPYSDSAGNLFTQDTLYFGKVLKSPTGDDYATTNTSRIEIKPNMVSGLVNPTLSYQNVHNIIYAPYFIDNQHPRQTIDKVIESRIAERYDDTSKKYENIEWIYNFKNKKVSLNADFSAHLNFPPTTIDQVNSNGDVTKTVDFSGDYQEGATHGNISGLYKIPRSALKSLHEVPVGFINYSSNPGDGVDTETNDIKIGTAQEQWNSGSTTERYLPPDIEREIYTPYQDSSGNIITPSGISYTYNSNGETDDFKGEEWEHIKQEINILFNPIKRVNNDDSETFTEGGDYQVIQSTVGLLTKGAGETQTRLLRLERAIFGVDAPTLPNGTIGKLITGTNHSEFLIDAGIMRAINSLLKLEILTDNNFYVNTAEPFTSFFKDVIFELFGEYENNSTFINNGGNPKGKFHPIYFWWLDIIKYEISGILNLFDQTKLSTTEMVRGERIPKGHNTARNLYLYKSQWGYQFDESPKPFFWPILLPEKETLEFNLSGGAGLRPQRIWNGILPKDSYWNFNIVGISDAVPMQNNTLKNQDRGGIVVADTDNNLYNISFASQSLEGILYDLILKISYIREQSYKFDESLLAEFTYLSKRTIFKNDSLRRFISDIPFFLKSNNKGILKDQSKPYIGNNLFDLENHRNEYLMQISGEYSAFGFINQKISLSYSMNLDPIYLPQNLSNYNNLLKPYFRFLHNKREKTYDLGILSVLETLKKYDYPQLTEVSGLIDDEYAKDSLPDFVIQYNWTSSGLAFDVEDVVNGAEDINKKFVASLEYEEQFIPLDGTHKYVVTYLGKWIKNIHYTKSHFEQSYLEPSHLEPSMLINSILQNSWIENSRLINSSYTPEQYTQEQVSLDRGTLPSLVLDNVSGQLQGALAGTRYSFNPGTLPELNYTPSNWTVSRYTVEQYTPEVYHPEVYTPEIYYPEQYTPEVYIQEQYEPEHINWDFMELWMVEDWAVTTDGTGIKVKKWFTDWDPRAELMKNDSNYDGRYMSGIATRPFIHDFHLFGNHIPKKYDVLEKIRAEEHLTKQLHLTLQSEPQNYPKRILNRTRNDVKINYILYNDNNCVVYWDPVHIAASNYVILFKYEETSSDLGVSNKTVTYITIAASNTNAFRFVFEKYTVEFKVAILPVELYDIQYIPEEYMSYIEEFIIATIEIKEDATVTINKTMVEDNQQLNILQKMGEP